MRASEAFALKLSSIKRGGKVALCAVAVALGISVPGMAAQNILPPAELGGLSLTNTAPARIHVAQAGDSAQLLVRIQQLEEQLRSQNGQIEGLTFQLTQMQEILNRLQTEIQALEGGAAGKNDAAIQPGGVTQPEALPQEQNTRPEIAPMTDIPAQGVQPLPGEVEFDPTYDDGSAPMDDLGNSSDPLVGTGSTGGVDLTTGQPLNLNYDPSASASGNADEDAQFTAGYEAMASGDYEFAEEQFGQFLDIYPDSPRAADAANFLGDALLQRQAYNEAADVLLGAYQKDPQGARAAELLVKLGASMSGAGEREVACRTFAQVDANYPSLTQDVAGRLAAEKTKAECPPA